MAENEKCIICNNSLKEVEKDSSQSRFHIKCDICGEYYISKECKDFCKTESFIKENSWVLSGIIREKSDCGIVIDINKKNIRELVDINNAPKLVLEKMDRVLLYIYRKTKQAGERFPLNLSVDYPIAFAKSMREFDYIIDNLLKLNFVSKTSAGYGIKIEGWKKIAEIEHLYKITGNKCFVAMWFDPSLENAFKNGFKKAIRESGYKPLRIDKKEYNESIYAEIVTEIRQSKLVVADFTGNREGVYFEAGFAMGLGIPVIYTCKEDWFEKIHFDVKPYNYIIWKNPKDLKEQLKTRILLTVPLR